MAGRSDAGTSCDLCYALQQLPACCWVDTNPYVCRTFHNFKADITETVYRGSIQSALQALYGATGGQLDWAVLQHQAGAGIVKVAARWVPPTANGCQPC